jgi:hypothetical protein
MYITTKQTFTRTKTFTKGWQRLCPFESITYYAKPPEAIVKHRVSNPLYRLVPYMYSLYVPSEWVRYYGERLMGEYDMDLWADRYASFPDEIDEWLRNNIPYPIATVTDESPKVHRILLRHRWTEIKFKSKAHANAFSDRFFNAEIDAVRWTIADSGKDRYLNPYKIQYVLSR